MATGARGDGVRVVRRAPAARDANGGGPVSTATKAPSKTACEKVLAAVAEWIGDYRPCGQCTACGAEPEPTWYCCDSPERVPAPTGREAAERGEGPMLVMDWDWPGSPTPTVILEGGPEDWAIRVTGDDKFQAVCAAAGVFAGPYASYALCLYREER